MKELLQKLIPRKITTAAIEIGEREIKFVALNPDGDSSEVTLIARYPIPTNVFGESLNEEALADVLGEMIGQFGLAGMELISAVGGENVVTRHLTLPHMPPKELHKAVLDETEKFMPISLNELEVRYVVLEEIAAVEGKELNILLAAVPTALVYQYYDLFKRFGLKLNALDLPVIALWRLYYREIAAFKGLTAIIDIGDTRTNLVISKGGGLKFTRTLPVGGYLLTKSMSENYGIDLDQARAMKEEHGMILNEDDLPGADAAQMQMDLSLRDGLGELVKEIRRSLEFFSAKGNADPLEKIFLSGGTCKLRGFDVFIKEALGVPVEVATPTAIHFDASDEYGFDPSLAVVYGLALREV